MPHAQYDLTLTQIPQGSASSTVNVVTQWCLQHGLSKPVLNEWSVRQLLCKHKSQPFQHNSLWIGRLNGHGFLGIRQNPSSGRQEDGQGGVAFAIQATQRLPNASGPNLYTLLPVSSLLHEKGQSCTLNIHKEGKPSAMRC